MHTYKEACVVLEQAQAWEPCSVSGESWKCGSALTLMNDLSRQCPTHAQLPFTQERDRRCVWERGETEVIFACVLGSWWVSAAVNVHCWVCVILSTLSHMWTAWQRHYTSQWFGGQGVSETAESMGVNTLTPAQPWGVFHYSGNPWSISDSNLRFSCPTLTSEKTHYWNLLKHSHKACAFSKIHLLFQTYVASLRTTLYLASTTCATLSLAMYSTVLMWIPALCFLLTTPQDITSFSTSSGWFL